MMLIPDRTARLLCLNRFTFITIPKLTWNLAALVIHLFYNYQLGEIYTLPFLNVRLRGLHGQLRRRQGLSGGYCVVQRAAHPVLNLVAASLPDDELLH